MAVPAFPAARAAAISPPRCAIRIIPVGATITGIDKRARPAPCAPACGPASRPRRADETGPRGKARRLSATVSSSSVPPSMNEYTLFGSRRRASCCATFTLPSRVRFANSLPSGRPPIPRAAAASGPSREGSTRACESPTARGVESTHGDTRRSHRAGAHGFRHRRVSIARAGLPLTVYDIRPEAVAAVLDPLLDSPGESGESVGDSADSGESTDESSGSTESVAEFRRIVGRFGADDPGAARLPRRGRGGRRRDLRRGVRPGARWKTCCSASTASSPPPVAGTVVCVCSTVDGDAVPRARGPRRVRTSRGHRHRGGGRIAVGVAGTPGDHGRR